MSAKQYIFKSIGLGLNTLSFFSVATASRLAFFLFGQVPPPRIRPKEQAFLDTADRLDIVWRQEQIPVYSWGPPAGKIVFCAYGWGYNAGRWRHYVPALTEAGYRVVAFDPPGHGHATGKRLDYPQLVDVERTLLRRLGGCELVLCHSFGGGCLIEALAELPPGLRPRRICVMAVFSEVNWIFQVFANSMGARPEIYEGMKALIEKRSGRRLEEFDVARNAARLAEVQTLLVHDPEDTVTAYRNARRNHSHWPGSYLYSPRGAGHHLGTAGVTRAVLAWLIAATVPEGAVRNDGQLKPLPAIVSAADLAVSGGVSDYYQ